MKRKLVIIELIKEHIINNTTGYIIMLAAFVAGICSGSFFTGTMGEQLTGELGSFMNNFTTAVCDGKMSATSVFLDGILGNFQMIFLIYMLGMTVIGLPFIMIVIGVKGFSIGFTTAAAIKFVGTKGVAAVFFTILPGELLIVPALLMMSVCAMGFSIKMIKGRTEKFLHKENLWNEVARYTLITGLLFTVIVIAVAYEAWLSPVFAGWIN